ncbi:cyclic nucleotide-binding domain-containing protein [Bradyrhizobium sp. CCBAU 51753]|uniref:cyclic nucleotide-binding domain-containing protein n=1 Tax=Bradyrhizobium sp. CCBAU 51753 TaxID=1325100 RepID=UPI0035300508
MYPHILEGNLVQPVIRRLNALRQLSERGIALLQQAIQDGLQRARAGEDLVSEGAPVDSVRIILSGWLCRYKMLEDGRRQIVNFVLPGDCCDACVYLLSVMDHSIGLEGSQGHGDHAGTQRGQSRLRRRPPQLRTIFPARRAEVLPKPLAPRVRAARQIGLRR